MNETNFTNIYANNPETPSAPPYTRYPAHTGQTRNPNRYVEQLPPPVPTRSPAGNKKKILGFQKLQFIMMVFFAFIILLLLVLVIVTVVQVYKLEDEIKKLNQSQVTNQIILGNNGTGTDLMSWSTCNNALSNSTQRIYPPGLGKWITVQCDLTTDGGNWVVFQKRSSSYVNFDVSYSRYVDGIGDASGDYWLGLETLHKMTQNKNYELRIDLKDWCSSTAYAVYSTFKVGSSDDNYKLTVSGYRGTAGDSLRYSDGASFTTTGYCSSKNGGWWFPSYSCTDANLNGRYYSLSCYYNYNSRSDGIYWQSFKGSSYSLRRAEMKIRLV